MTIAEPSQVGDARRAVLAQAKSLGWDDSESGVAALLVTEAGTNLIGHAGQGMILFGVDAERRGLEFLVLDRGPGLPHARAVADGFSTTGTAGLGLGSLRRLATESDLYSTSGGTAIFMRYEPSRRGGAARPPATDLAVGGLSVAKPEERACGDATAVFRLHERTVVAVCDGLGHGPAAQMASRTVLDACGARLGHGLTDMIESAHAAARHTRGAALLLVEIDEQHRVVRSCGVGNIAGRIVGHERSVHLVSVNGTIGAQLNKLREFTHPWEADSTVVVHSDGVQSRWSLDDYPGWRQRHPMLVAGLLYRDCSRGHDDASIVVAHSGRVQ